MRQLPHWVTTPIRFSGFRAFLALLCMLGCADYARGDVVTYEFEGVFVESNSLFAAGDTFVASYTLEPTASTVAHPDPTLDIQSQAISGAYPGTGWEMTVFSSAIGDFTLVGALGLIAVGNDNSYGDRYTATLYSAAPLPGGLTLNFFQFDVQDPVANGADMLADGLIQSLPDLALATNAGGRFFVSGDTGGCTQCHFTVTSLSTSFTTVSLDVKPGSYPNCFNVNGRGVIPVAILGSQDFDVNDVDASTLLFAGLEVRVKGNSNPQCSIEDVSGDFTSPEGAPDGFDDLVCQFADDPATWSPGEDEACVTGVLLDETPIEGCDSICIVP